MPSMSALRILAPVFKVIRAHGEETYPHECCGALLDQKTPHDWRIEVSMRAANTHTESAHNRYSILPTDLVRIERNLLGRLAVICRFM